jgi:BirA family biotin operon repressor/biotin-[acetyl-CoA-carboxylase] ligase
VQNYNKSPYKIPANTLFMGKQLVYVPECHSTNSEAQRLLLQQPQVEGTVVVTDSQTAGRGQRGNVWVAAPFKNLTFTLICTPKHLGPTNQIYLAMAVSLGVADWLNGLLAAERVNIKWPNDILVDEYKVCGILIENHLTGNQIAHSIVGIGININQVSFEFPFAGSVKMFTGREHDLADCLEGVLEQIESRYLMLRNNDYELIRANYLENFYWLGEQHIFSSGDRRFSGVITGVDQVGNLEIEIDGNKKSFGFKEVAFIR